MIEIQDDENVGSNGDKFGHYEEEVIIRMMFDEPEFMQTILQFLKDDYFERYETQFVFGIMAHYYEKHQVMITRELCADTAKKLLTADDPHAEILRIIQTKSDPRDVPVVRNTLAEWARQKQYSLLYSQEAMEAHEQGDYSYHDRVVDEAKKINEFGIKLFWLFDDYEQLFKEDSQDHFTTGFPKLDTVLNEGGPIKGDVLCFMAPTGVGKSIALVNTGIANARNGRNVLHVTLEMSDIKTGHRYLGPATNLDIKDRLKNKDKMISRLNSLKEDSGHIIIARYPPEEISIDEIRSVIDTLKRIHGVTVDVLIIDYLELMVPRDKATSEYERQKKVSTELGNLAVTADVFLATASQTNRSGTDGAISESAGGGKNKSSSDDKVIDLNKTAESYGKNMPLSYVITINQSRNEYIRGRENQQDEDSPNTAAECRLYIAKNRNGQKFKTLRCNINYERMHMTEVEWDEAWKRQENRDRELIDTAAKMRQKSMDNVRKAKERLEQKK